MTKRLRSRGCEELTTLEIDTGVGTLVEIGLLGRGEFDLYLTDDGLAAPAWGRRPKHELGRH